ncbi:hypothetical protein [Halobaculum rarum]|uniref:hypothetical protein n=1 Tax=Halobaculum rarum TaxID=3075122 RepID=UPI0032AF6CE9
MDHPSVELKLPLDGGTHRVEIPQETTLFFWGAVAPGTTDRLIPKEGDAVGSQQRAVQEISNCVSWRISLPDESKPLLDERYRKQGYNGRAWWIARDPMSLPATVEIEFNISRDPPTIDGAPIVLWTEQGETIPWGSTIESTVELVPSTKPAPQFQTRQEQLWNRHTVYIPSWNPVTDKSYPHIEQ